MNRNSLTWQFGKKINDVLPAGGYNIRANGEVRYLDRKMCPICSAESEARGWYGSLWY